MSTLCCIMGASMNHNAFEIVKLLCKSTPLSTCFSYGEKRPITNKIIDTPKYESIKQSHIFASNGARKLNSLGF